MPLRLLAVLCTLLLVGCTAPARVEQAPAELSLPAADPLLCSTRSDCTTKVSRTLLFVFDYAAAGGALVQRRERLLFTPDDAVANDWPALHIRLAAPADSRFEFSAECQVGQCRYSAEQLLRVYRSYLADRPCSLLLDSAVRACAELPVASTLAP